mmetsp:Transcript_67800/g.192456  ORF Transcript_67800/g.192456 Transcript_67800/m.192456 type:complete len:218 (+) Transcript_67800:279-932(+)
MLVRRQDRHSGAVAQPHHRVMVKPAVIAVLEAALPPPCIAASLHPWIVQAHVHPARMVCRPIAAHVYALGIVGLDRHHLEGLRVLADGVIQRLRIAGMGDRLQPVRGDSETGLDGLSKGADRTFFDMHDHIGLCQEHRPPSPRLFPQPFLILVADSFLEISNSTMGQIVLDELRFRGRRVNLDEYHMRIPERHIARFILLGVNGRNDNNTPQPGPLQ